MSGAWRCRRTRWGLFKNPWHVLALSAPLLILVLAPLVALLLRGASPARILAAAGSSHIHQVVSFSLWTSGASLLVAILCGTPLAYVLARHEFRFKRVIEVLFDLPMVLPPAVAGLALLLAFGRQGILAPLLEPFQLRLAFSSAAVVIAQTFVSAPFYIRAARAGFESVNPRLEQVAATMGAAPFVIFTRITVPIAFPGLVAGAVMAWARALGEFGATLMFAGNFTGRQTMPLAIYGALESDLNVGTTLSLMLLAVSCAVTSSLSMARSNRFPAS